MVVLVVVVGGASVVDVVVVATSATSFVRVWSNPINVINAIAIMITGA